MRFQEIMRFRRTATGAVPLEVLKSLQLPIPEDVLEQFLFDHGTKGEFQLQYGNIDLHGLRWELMSIQAAEILGCSVYPEFGRWIETVAGRTRVVPQEGWRAVQLPPGAAQHWQSCGTWIRPPVMLQGEVLKSNRTLHLVEGHTRIGALLGLIQSEALPSSSIHLVWVGNACTASEEEGPWRDVLRKEHMPFLDWLMDQVGEEGDLGIIASSLIDAKYAATPARRIVGDDLQSALAYAAKDPALTSFKNQIRQAHSEWNRRMNE
jgi:hypothetical protein